MAKKQKGLTLVESLITVLIISTAFIALTRLQLNTWKITEDTRLLEIAHSLIYTKADEIAEQLSHAVSTENGSSTQQHNNIAFLTKWTTKTRQSGAIEIHVTTAWKSKSIQINTIQHPVDRSMKNLIPPIK
ncbi:MAG: prepilin-type N-terminal cleavage/methylation domain-containing protein [Gammaproteobacteria bacterium]